MPKSRFSFVVTISPGYMFALNATMNSMKYYGTNADFHVIYHSATPVEYREACSKAFPFDVIWEPMQQREPNLIYTDSYHMFFSDKYWLADKIKDEYDAVCIIDGDLFLCGNMNEWFEMAFNQKKLISADHKHSGLTIEGLFNFGIDDIRDRMYCSLADFPVFFDPKYHNQFIKDWYLFTFDHPSSDETSHPLVAFNRSLRKNLKPEDIVVLDGHQWVCDYNYWQIRYTEKDMMMWNPERVFGIHNRWWKCGRANGELRDNRNGSDHFFNALHNFNSIRDFMAKFNLMTPETYWDDYVKEEFK